jgi:RNA polymerase sigma-70 factor (ECF subfamily)
MSLSSSSQVKVLREQNSLVETQREIYRFQTTRWSLVLRAGGEDGRRAAAELYRAYWQPVHAFFRSHGARESEEEASDLTQGFFTELHARGDVATLHASRGKFRTWLCVCAKNYLCAVRRRERALSRKGVRESLDELDGAAQTPPELHERRDPDLLFNRRWALTVISRALDRLRQHYADCDKSELFESLEGRWSSEGSELTDADLAALLGKTQPAVSQSRLRLKADAQPRFARFVRAEIAETVSAREHIDDEIRALLRALA